MQYGVSYYEEAEKNVDVLIVDCQKDVQNVGKNPRKQFRRFFVGIQRRMEDGR
jgi:hypothetical protein